MRTPATATAANSVSRRRRPTGSAVGYACESLEARRLLSTITWVNRGTGAGAGDTDSFNAIYGANAAAARAIVDRAIDDWEAVIVNFNGSGGRNTFNLTVRAQALANASGDTDITGFDAADKPNAARILLDDLGANWYFDPVIAEAGVPDDGEFTTVRTPFNAAVPGSSPISMQRDLYRVITHEIGHAMGMSSLSDRITDNEVDIGPDPLDPTARLTTLTFGSTVYTMTDASGRHLFENTHPHDLMNDGRNAFQGIRKLISDVDVRFLRDVFGYTVVLPGTINTFLANLNTTTNVVTVTGDPTLETPDADLVTVSSGSGQLSVIVDTTIERIPNSAFSTLVINAGAGNDTIDLDGLPAGKSVTANGDAGDDLFRLGSDAADLDAVLLSNVTLDGGSNRDDLVFLDQNDPVGNDVYTFNAGSLAVGARTFASGGFENATLFGPAQAAVYNVNQIASGLSLTLFTGAVNDSIRVAGGSYLANVLGPLTVFGGGTDDVVVDDTAEPVLSGFNLGSASRLSRSGTSHAVTMQSTATTLRVNGAASAPLFVTVGSLNAAMDATFVGGSTGDRFEAGNGTARSLFGNLRFIGNGGTDTLFFDDTLAPAGGPFRLSSTEVARILTGSPAVAYETIEQVNLDLTAGADSLEVSSTAAGVNYDIDLGDGNDEVAFRDGTAADQLGNMILAGGAGTDALTYADAVNVAGTLTLTSARVRRGPAGGPVDFGGVEAVVLTGDNGIDTIDVQSTSVPVTVSSSGGNDAVTVGAGNFTANILAEVFVDGGTGTDTVTADDSANSRGVAMTLTGISFTADRGPALRLGTSGGIADPITPTVDAFVLLAGTGDDAIAVDDQGGAANPLPSATQLPMDVTVRAGGGNDAITVAAGRLNALAGTLRIEGGAGAADVVTFRDASDTGADAYTFDSAGVLTKSDWAYAPTVAADVEQRAIEANTGANAINLTTGAGVVTVRGGGGLDTVAVDGGATAVFDRDEDLADLRLTASTSGARLAAGGGVDVDTGTVSQLRGFIDLADGLLVVRDAGTAGQSALNAATTRGFAGGTWAGVPTTTDGVVRSSTAAATPGTAVGFAIATDLSASFPFTFAGHTLNSASAVLRYTLAADTNLDLTVNHLDYNVLAANLNQAAPRRFSQGDGNYDGVVNAADRDALFAQFSRTLLPGPGAITGTLFADVDADGVFDASGDFALAGREVYLDVNGNAARDPAEPTRTTGGAGQYAFDAVGPGNYAVRQVLPAGWTQTFPSPPTAAHAPSLALGQSFVGNFGSTSGSPAAAPQVVAVFVSGTTWAQTFKNFLASSGVGDATHGFRVNAAEQTDELPWTNLNKVSIRFSKNVNVAADDLTVTGVNVASYALLAGGFAYDAATFTASWTLAAAGVANDKLRLRLDSAAGTGVTDTAGVRLDGEWNNPVAPAVSGDAYPSGDGTAGGDFVFRLNVLPGDANRSGGSVIGSDVTLVRNAQNASPGAAGSLYTIFKDVNGSGTIVGSDVTAVRNRQGLSLPGGEPAALVVSPTTQTVFVSRPAPLVSVHLAEELQLFASIVPTTFGRSTRL